MTQAHEHDGVPPDLAELYPEVGAAPSSGDAADADGIDALHAMLDAEGPADAVSGLSTPVRWALAGLQLVVIVGVVLISTRRADFDVYPLGRMALDLSLMLGPLLLALVATFRPLSKPALPGSRRAQAIVFGVLGLAILMVMPEAHDAHSASHAGVGSVFWRQAGSCFAFGLSFSALTAFGLGLLSRNGPRRWLPSSLGIWAAGLTGLIALYLHCPITDLEHLWVGHATVAVPVLVLAFLLRGRVDG